VDFFEAQASAHRLSRRLVVLFGLAVASMIGVVYLVALVSLGLSGEGPAGLLGGGWLHPELLGAVALGMGAIIGGGSAFRTAQLRRGGGAVASLLGGREVPPDTGDPLERRLRNVVEEMSIASGIPVPAVYVLDGEPAINAFAAGHSIHDAAVAVTRGSLESLRRDELQGVVAHEFSHILNGDMRLNLRLIGLLFGILLLTVVGRGILRGSGGRRGRKGGQIALVGLALVLLGYLGVFFGRMIQAAVSRQREFLADASAVQFTRNPAGIAGALRRIGAGGGSRIRNHHAEEAGHLFFADGLRGALTGLLSTHPPLEERIRRIDPSWDGSFEIETGREGAPAPAAHEAGRPPEPETPLGPAGSGLPFPFPAPGPGLASSGPPALGLQAAGLVGTVGAPRPGHLRVAREILAGVPDELRNVARSPDGAEALVVALLLSATSDVRERQLDLARSELGPDIGSKAAGLAGSVAEAGPAARLPLLDLALPALRELPADRGAAFEATVSALIRADGRVHAFEFALFHVVRRNLEARRDGAGVAGRRGAASLSRLRRDAEAILSALARSGAGDEASATRAFDVGARLLFPDAEGTGRLQPVGAVQLDRVDEALGRLADLRPEHLRRLLDAAVATILADRRVAIPEVEMLRAVAEALEAPMPPLLAPDAA
jgi:Zn-dependent protease with chaperone function